MMHTVPVVEAKAGFSALIARVEAGEEVAITRHGKVVEGAPFEHYGMLQSSQAIQYADTIIEYVRSKMA